MADVTCPQCDGKKGPFTVFLNRGAAGCSVEQRPCSRCNGTGTINDYEARLYAEGQRVRKARQAADLSLHEASRILGCSTPELSAIEHGREPAFHDSIIERLTPKIDEEQLRLNGGPYCYHVEAGKFCGRAERWPGHGRFHDFKGAASTGQGDSNG